MEFKSAKVKGQLPGSAIKRRNAPQPTDGCVILTSLRGSRNDSLPAMVWSLDAEVRQIDT